MRQSHGLTKSPFYRIWYNMRDRCNNPKHKRFKDYGAKGIKADWPDFQSFIDDMFEKYQTHCKRFGAKDTLLGRIDTTKNYNKDNSVWLTKALSSLSKQRTIWLTFRDITLPMKAMAEKYNISYTSFRRKTNQGWSPAKIVRFYNKRTTS